MANSKPKISFKDLLKAAKRGAKSGPKKNLYAAVACGAVVVGLLIWWIVTLTQLLG